MKNKQELKPKKLSDELFSTAFILIVGTLVGLGTLFFYLMLNWCVKFSLVISYFVACIVVWALTE